MTVAALASADKEDDVVVSRKFRNMRHAVSHLATDGVETLESSSGGDVVLDIIDDTTVLVEVLRGLRIEVDILGDVEFLLYLVEAIHDDRLNMGRADESQYLRMSFLSENDGLSFGTVRPLPLDTALQGEDHRPSGIDDLYIILPGNLISLGRLAIGTEQHLCVVQLTQLLVVDGDKSLLVQTLHLHAVVHDVTQAIEFAAFCQLFLGLADGSGDAKAEAAAVVYFYL